MDKRFKRSLHQILSENCVLETTIESIIFQEYQRKTKKFYYWHNNPDKMASYYNKYQKAAQNKEGCGFLINIADEVDLSPSLMARIIIEMYYKTQKLDGEIVPKPQISEHLKNTSLIEDGQLAAEIHLCNLYDENYGPISDVIRRSVGTEYEARLKDDLNKLGISFVDENILREKGYDKTPDVKLETPIAIDGKVVNWIESKASFGDEERHKEYLKDQYWSYLNRFGPGLVIYWFGFIEEINIHKDQGIMISDHIPDDVTFMDPLSLVKNYFDQQTL